MSNIDHNMSNVDYVTHCIKLNDDKDPYKNILNIESNIDCIQISKANIDFKKAFDPIISEMCNNTELSTLYKDDLDKIKEICGCFPIGFTNNYNKATKFLGEEGDSIEVSCNPNCKSNIAYEPMNLKQCNIDTCIQNMLSDDEVFKIQSCTPGLDLPDDTESNEEPKEDNTESKKGLTKTEKGLIIGIIVLVICLICLLMMKLS